MSEDGKAWTFHVRSFPELKEKGGNNYGKQQQGDGLPDPGGTLPADQRA